MRKKRILISSLFFAFLMLMIPCVNAVENNQFEQTRDSKNLNIADKVEEKKDDKEIETIKKIFNQYKKQQYAYRLYRSYYCIHLFYYVMAICFRISSYHR